MANHVRLAYTAELRELEERSLGTLDMVADALSRTLEAIEHDDAELAGQIVADDDRIDGRYIELHQSMLTLLARQAPVATDLRLIAALLYVMKSVERMGDQCVNCAKLIPLTGSNPPRDASLVRDVITMGRQVRTMLGQTKKAFLARDLDLARDLVRQDDVVDNLNREAFATAIRIGDDLDTREWATTMLLIARALERIGDNAVDIGEQVAFVVTGLFQEFEDASHTGPPSAPAV